MGVTEIIRKGFANGDSYEVINKALADGGFNLKLVPRDIGWTDKEMYEGFNEGEPAKDVVRLADLMKPRKEYAGKDVYQWCAGGQYRVSYDANGYATKAVRI